MVVDFVNSKALKYNGYIRDMNDTQIASLKVTTNSPIFVILNIIVCNNALKAKSNFFLNKAVSWISEGFAKV